MKIKAKGLLQDSIFYILIRFF